MCLLSGVVGRCYIRPCCSCPALEMQLARVRVLVNIQICARCKRMPSTRLWYWCSEGGAEVQTITTAWDGGCAWHFFICRRCAAPIRPL